MKILQVGLEKAINWLERDLYMGYLDENEWILLNEIAYNISYIFTVEEMQDEILNRWLPILIPYDAAVLARLSRTTDGGYVFTETYGYHLSPKMLDIWQEQTQKADAYRWLLYSNTSATFRESAFREEDKLKNTPIYESFYEPNGLCYSAGLCICFREEPVGFLRLYRRKEKGEFAERDLFALSQLHKHLAYRLIYEAKRGDTRFFFAKGYHDKICRQYNLTEREGEMLDLAVHGMTNEEIAQKLNISIHTVKKHFQSVYTKMNVHNRVQMVQNLPFSSDKINFDEL